METITKRSNLNNTVITGNVVKDGIVSEDGNRLNFAVAVEQPGKDQPMFVECVQFAGEGRQPLATELARKGTPVTIEGYLKDNPKDGYKNLTLVVRGAYFAPRVGTSITGNVVADPRKGEKDGLHYAAFRIAHNMGKDADGKDKALFIDCVATAKDAAKLPAVIQGQSVIVKGRLSFSKREKDGKTYENWTIFAWSVKDNPLVEYELTPAKVEDVAPADMNPLEILGDLPADAEF